jgi:hypothetical protein
MHGAAPSVVKRSSGFLVLFSLPIAVGPQAIQDHMPALLPSHGVPKTGTHD